MNNKIKYHKPFIKLFLIVISIYGCTNNHNDIDEFKYSYCNFFDTSFSFKISNQDTILVKQNYHGNDIDFRTIISPSDKEQINQWLIKYNFEKYDTSYVEYFEDGESHNFYLKNKNYSKSIHIHSENTPMDLKTLSKKMLVFKRKLATKALR